ncbi:MAG: virulence RhuM family protein [Methanomassiliicoccaceae archaeon]|nr:virulence RhuM family protein [Methanomassiliicoccaceae archaeon]
MKKEENDAVPYQEEKKSSIVKYRPDDTLKLDVRLENGTVWLTLDQIAVLFGRDRSTISRHIKNVFKERGTKRSSAVANYATTAADGKRYMVDYYNLDVIYSVGLRTRSASNAGFFEWASESIEKYENTAYLEEKRGEIVLYEPDDTLKLEVLFENETVWLTQGQMAELFQTSFQNISLHINNAFREGELEPDSVLKESLNTAADGKGYLTKYYDLDVIISVGYRVRSLRGTFFRRWATRTLRDHILKGYTINYRLEQIERCIGENKKDVILIDGRLTDAEKKIDFFVRTSLPPVHGIFCEGQIFDAYAFVSDLIRSAKNSIVLLDNYTDETVLLLLSKRSPDVDAKIYTKHISQQFRLDLNKHNAQYDPIDVQISDRFHDRFLIIDDKVYHIGASLKDLGKKLFAFSRIEIKDTELLKGI